MAVESITKVWQRMHGHDGPAALYCFCYVCRSVFLDDAPNYGNTLCPHCYGKPGEYHSVLVHRGCTADQIRRLLAGEDP